MGDYFKVDRKGLADILTRTGKGFVVTELLQNAFDEDTARVDVTVEELTPEQAALAAMNSPRDSASREEGLAPYRVAVEDDAGGFADLSHAWTLFAPSEKKSSATRRGRFNLGEKLVIAACEKAVISSTTGTVTFAAGERSVDEGPDACRERGSRFEGYLWLSAAEREEMERTARAVIVPERAAVSDRPLTVAFNGQPLPERVGTHVRTFETPLITEISDPDGSLRRTRRKALVSLYEPLEGERATLYEMGIPVVETDDRFHVDVGQKIPLTTDRENVQRAYMKAIRLAVLENTTDLLDEQSAAGGWVSEALEHEKISASAVGAVLDARYGQRRVINDTSDAEGTKIAVSKGYSVIHGGAFNREQWKNIKRAGAALPAGKVTPSPKPEASEQEGTILDPADYPAVVARCVSYSKMICERLLGEGISVRVVNEPGARYYATWSKGEALAQDLLTYNLGTLGESFFEAASVESPEGLEAFNELLLHEAGHHYEGNHLDSNYADACSRLGARLAHIASTTPCLFDGLCAPPLVSSVAPSVAPSVVSSGAASVEKPLAETP